MSIWMVGICGLLVALAVGVAYLAEWLWAQKRARVEDDDN